MTWPLLSISMTEVALVSFMSLFKAVEMIASSRSEITRFVSCSMYALPSVYTLGKKSHYRLRDIKCFQNFGTDGFHQVADAANIGGIIRECDHEGKVTKGINTYQPIFKLHQHTNDITA